MSRPQALAGGLLAGAALLGTACQIDISTGDPVTRSFEIGDEIERLEVANAFDVTVEVGAEPSLEIEVDEEIVDRLRVDTDGDRLSIGFDDGLISTSGPMEVRLTLPRLTAIDADGAVSADIAGLESERFELDVGGASSVDGEGTVGVLVVNADGASRIDFDGVEIDRVEVDVDGASHLEITGAGAVTGTAGGASSIEVSDDTTIDVETSGASSVERG